GNFGAAINGTDASDFGGFADYSRLGTGGQVSAPGQYNVSAGGQVKSTNGANNNGGGLIDQLPGNQWFDIINPSGSTYFIRCPVGHAVTSTCPNPGSAFTGFTRGGVPIDGEGGEAIIYRPN